MKKLFTLILLVAFFTAAVVILPKKAEAFEPVTITTLTVLGVSKVLGWIAVGIGTTLAGQKIAEAYFGDSEADIQAKLTKLETEYKKSWVTLEGKMTQLKNEAKTENKANAEKKAKAEVK